MRKRPGDPKKREEQRKKRKRTQSEGKVEEKGGGKGSGRNERPFSSFFLPPFIFDRTFTSPADGDW